MRKRPAATNRPPRRYRLKRKGFGFVYAKSGTGHKLLTTSRKWESWPR